MGAGRLVLVARDAHAATLHRYVADCDYNYGRDCHHPRSATQCEAHSPLGVTWPGAYMAPRIVARQLSHPSGILGGIIRFLMNRANARMNAFALDKLGVTKGDRVLEVGFGGGLLLRRLLERASLVCGLDRSRQAVAVADKRFARAVREGRAEFREGTVESLPFGDGHFNKAITINTVYFWRSLAAGFVEIHRVLGEGGLAVIGFLPKEFMDRMNMPGDIFTARASEDVTSAMRDAGFKNVRLEQPDAATKWRIAIGTK